MTTAAPGLDPLPRKSMDAWIRDLGLGQYSTILQNQHISIDEILLMDDTQLAEIGIKNQSHRRVILDWSRSECEGGVRLQIVGDEINEQLALTLIAIHIGEPLSVGDRIAYFDSNALTYRLGLVSGPVGQTVVARKSGIAIETQPNTIQIMDIIDVLRFCNEGVPAEWLRGRVLGEGAFGCVFEAIDVNTGSRLAIKQIPIRPSIRCKKNGAIDQTISKLCNEITVIRLLTHDNIVRFIGTRIDHARSCLYIFMELVSGGSLYQVVREYGPLPESLIQNYTCQILYGLEYLHDHGIVHRDIKGSNILVSGQGVVKLADFGAARLLQDACEVDDLASNTVCGTPSWMAPEALVENGYGPSCDIWSLGCTIIEMGSGRRPWDPDMDQYQVLWALSQSDRIPAIPSNLSEMAMDFCRQCLVRDPRTRPTSRQLLNHPWIKTT